MALQGLKVPGHPLPLLHVNAPEPAKESVGFVLAVERGECRDEDAAAVDVAGGGLAQDDSEAAAAVDDEGDVDHGRAG